MQTVREKDKGSAYLKEGRGREHIDIMFMYASECEKYSTLCGDINLLEQSSMSAGGSLCNRVRSRRY